VRGPGDQAGFKCYGLLIFWPRYSWLLIVIRDLPFTLVGATDYWLASQPVKRPEAQKGFKVIPRRWVVERTFSWFSLIVVLSKGLRVLATINRDSDLCGNDSFNRLTRRQQVA